MQVTGVQLIFDFLNHEILDLDPMPHDLLLFILCWILLTDARISQSHMFHLIGTDVLKTFDIKENWLDGMSSEHR